jgi:hypothetical protein
MTDFAMRHQPPANGNSAPGAGGSTPGKRALTDSMSGPRTGIATIDDGTACERAPGAGCFLSDTARTRLIMYLIARVHEAHGNLKTELARKRVEILCSKASGWGFVAELVANIVILVATNAIGAAIARLSRGASPLLDEATLATMSREVAAATALAAAAPAVRGAVQQLGPATRAELKERAKHLPPGAVAKMEFLLATADGVDAHGARLTELLPSQLDDYGLLVLVEAYDHAAHSPTIYANEVDSLIARYTAAEIDVVGVDFSRQFSPEHGERQGRLDVVRFLAAGRARDALVEQRHTLQRQDDPAPGAPKPTDSSTLHAAWFVRWLDDDLAPAAAAAHEQRTGAILTIDLDVETPPPNMAPPVLEWLTGSTWLRGREVIR